jgi:hypothetical protein
MWNCEECGCQRIAGDLVSCPMCGKERDTMPKINAETGPTYAPGTEPEGVPSAAAAAPAATADAAKVDDGASGEPATSDNHAGNDNAPAGQSDEDVAVDVNGDGQLDHYETATKADLATEAGRRGLSTAGSKTDLVKRLQDADAAARVPVQQAPAETGK